VDAETDKDVQEKLLGEPVNINVESTQESVDNNNSSKP
jgi:hypothetical protein